ncbi:ankyrin repeat protein [Aspergillus thermomutatus]|uniref:Uncharacterized protein n=1 Tax=Aspergillus thermomutatus TaxID=41047 RepID=A0A397G7B8_ASPTH|nr:uncharacterized protein CDV56_104723 [Aspergillus thermomutatus]RHZ46921.1 hypothetical protein CDV56_104723 [Aspergillus thermomutatus]
MANQSPPRRRSLLDDLPLEIMQMILGYLNDEELRRLVRDVQELASHAKEVIKFRFKEKNTYTLPDEAAVLEHHGGRLPDNVNPDNVALGTIAGIIRTNNLEILKVLVEAGLDLMSFSLGGWRLGLALAWDSAKDVARYLIDEMKPEDLLHGVCRVGRQGEPPNFLTLAACYSADIFRQMWQRVHHLPNWQDHVPEVARFQLCRERMRFLHGNSLRTAAESNDNMDFIEYLYGRIPESINAGSSENRRTPLMIAAAERWHDRSNAIGWLLRHGADATIMVEDGKTAAWFASAAHRADLARLLSSSFSPYSESIRG